jgi:hypothetical protein
MAAIWFEVDLGYAEVLDRVAPGALRRPKLGKLGKFDDSFGCTPMQR